MDHLDILQENMNLTHNINARLRDELQKEQMGRELRAAVEKAEKLEMELHTICKLREDETDDREYERAYTLKRIEELEDREDRLRVVVME
jgi:hypothetical protein